MAEAITVVGLVAAIIQITKCSKRILDHCKDVNDKSIQVPRSIQSVTIQLPVLNHVLDQVKYHVESNSSHQDPWPALRSLLGACSKEIRHLEGVLSNIIPSSPAKSWNKTSLLMKSLRYDAEVTRTTHNLGQLTHTVHFYLTNETAQSTRMLVANSQKLLQIAILQRAKVRFERCLPQDDKSMLERNLLGQTALHLAADWPWACQLLLDAGADYTVTDRLHLLPLSYACQLSCCDTVQMLLAAGSPFLTNDVESTHVLEHAVVANADEELLSFLVQELAHRRRLLLESAKALLPRQKFSAITASMNGLPDTEAPSLVYAINEVGGSADPNYYCCTAYTIYNISYLTTTLAEQLYAAGFQNVTARDSAGFTPLVREVTRTRKVWDPMDPTPMNFPMIMWYFRKGASFLQPTPSKASNSRWVSTVNLVAQEIGQWFELEVHSHLSFEQRLQILPKESMKEVLQLVLGSRFIGSHDFCRCKCSLSGCRPPKMFLKGFGWYRYLQRRTLLRLRLIDWIIEILLATGDPRDSWVFSHSALRLCLFEDLGLRHTCCRITSGGIVPPVDLEEAQEMTEEDTLPRQRFHELYPKIDADWERTTASFSDFYTKILRDHIQQDGNEGMDPAYVKSLEAAGVRILDKDSQSQVLSNDFEEETFTEVGGNSQVIENPTI
ncbi:uncharacterized protein KY384_008763 [Bacidia gigantensis]|uniref:uncharacterized protein n=1 Tax=Bacidia gigantensis TaxID=2732470 RepID=UPI001D03C62A|nr:uncharacterized protein KY384_008763 [Bacidia gigantensis]KAG8526562.1 hypothetical protein KY384_008763 [Bacidia gigantensis]